MRNVCHPKPRDGAQLIGFVIKRIHFFGAAYDSLGHAAAAGIRRKRRIVRVSFVVVVASTTTTTPV